MSHGPHCPTTTTSKYFGQTLHVDAKQAAVITMGVAFVKSLLGALLGNGKMDLTEMGREGADIAEQAIEHPNVYHPRHR